MKPLKLTMMAFGPYAGKVELDFTKGLRENIFVITGNTGAGKTTIFDAICYALYSTTSDNNGRQTLELRSHFADEHTEKTYVEFEFEIRGQAYRVKRTPQQIRKKARGTGFTEEKNAVEFKKLTEDSISITRAEDVERELNSLLGLSLEQFKRIVMLPQGAFREFLQDKSSNKTELLRRLFDTTLYDNLTDYLGTQARELSASVKNLELKIYTDLAHIAREPESELDELIANKGHIPDIMTLLKSLLDELEHAYTQEVKAGKQLSEQLVEVEKSVYKAREQQMFIDERGQLELRLQTLNAQAANIAILEQEYVKAELAEKNLATEEILLQIGSESKQLAAELAAAKKELPSVCEHAAQAQAQLSAIAEREQQITDMQGTLTLLQSYLPKIKQLESLEQSLLSLKKELTVKEQALVMSEKKEQLERIERQKNCLRDLYKELRQLGQYQEALHKADNEQHELSGKIQKLEAALHNKRELLLNSAAISLARALKAGEKCPVCGSVEHPELPDIHSDIPTADVVDRLDKELSSAKKSVEKLLQISKAAQLELGKCEAKIAGMCAREDIQLLVGEVVPELSAIESWGVQLKMQADAIRDEFVQQGLNVTELPDQAILSDNVQQIKMRINSVQGQLSILLTDVPADKRDIQAINKEIHDLDTAINAAKSSIQDLRSTAEQTNLIMQRLKVQIEGLEINVKSKIQVLHEWQSKHDEFLRINFQGQATDYIKAKTQISQIDSLKKQVQEHQKALNNCNIRLYELGKLIVPDEFELIAIEHELADKREALQTIQANINALKQSLDNNKRIAHIAKVDLSESGIRIEQYALLSKLFKLANGGAAHRMKLETFVLSAYFDDILAHANVRMQKMTNNRYLLVRSTDSGGRGFKGLDIDVDDAHTGRLRSVSTLSGGESFKASLALALGLADVVQANAGGIQLDTMLIDEGFGTLDEESLDVAIDTLMELQEHGRIIGVISHVPTLKNRIACKLVVENGTEGSTAYFE